MTNEEASMIAIKIYMNKKTPYFTKVGDIDLTEKINDNDFILFVGKAIESLAENTKLKAEIERLKGELKSEREWRYNARIELLDRNKEIELLKEEIESRKTAGIKNNSNSRNDIEQLKSINAKLCEEIAELKEEKSDIITKIEYCLNECEPMYGGRSCGKSAKQIYKMAFEYFLELLKGGAE